MKIFSYRFFSLFSFCRRRFIDKEMSSTSSSKRQLPNLQSDSTDKIRHLNTALIVMKNFRRNFRFIELFFRFQNTENNLRHAQQNFELLKQIQTQQPNPSTSLLDAFRSNGTTNFDVDGSSRRSTSSSSQHQRSSSNKGVRFTDDHMGQSLHQFNNELQSLSNEHGRLKTEIHRTRKSTTLFVEKNVVFSPSRKIILFV